VRSKRIVALIVSLVLAISMSSLPIVAYTSSPHVVVAFASSCGSLPGFVTTITNNVPVSVNGNKFEYDLDVTDHVHTDYLGNPSWMENAIQVGSGGSITWIVEWDTYSSSNLIPNTYSFSGNFLTTSYVANLLTLVGSVNTFVEFDVYQNGNLLIQKTMYVPVTSSSFTPYSAISFVGGVNTGTATFTKGTFSADILLANQTPASAQLVQYVRGSQSYSCNGSHLTMTTDEGTNLDQSSVKVQSNTVYFSAS
jgi:hypothetical protein